MAAWIQRMRGALAPPSGIDAPAANAMIIAGLQHVVLTSVTAQGFGGLPLSSDADWERLRSTLRQMIGRIYAEPGQGASPPQRSPKAQHP